MRRTRRVAALAAASAVVAACAAPSGNQSSPGTDGLTQLAVGSSPTISNASLYLGTQDGTFAAGKLVVTPQQIQSGQQAVPQLLNGQIQFAAADPLGTILAISNHTPIKFVANGNVVPSDPQKDASGLIARADGPVKTLADLNGRTVAVNATKSLGQVALEAAIDAKGGDSSTVKFVEIGFPQMIAAVKNGTVDAAATTEPFVTAASTQGLQAVPFGGLSTTLDGVPQVVYVTSDAYATAHPDIVKQFATAMDASNAKLSNDPDKIRQIGATSTSIGADTLGKIRLPTFGPKLSTDKLTQLEDLMVKYKVMSAPVGDLASRVIES